MRCKIILCWVNASLWRITITTIISIIWISSRVFRIIWIIISLSVAVIVITWSYRTSSRLSAFFSSSFICLSPSKTRRNILSYIYISTRYLNKWIIKSFSSGIIAYLYSSFSLKTENSEHYNHSLLLVMSRRKPRSSPHFILLHS